MSRSVPWVGLGVDRGFWAQRRAMVLRRWAASCCLRVSVRLRLHVPVSSFSVMASMSGFTFEEFCSRGIGFRCCATNVREIH